MTSHREDGVFWMEFNDFLRFFGRLDVGFVRHLDHNFKPWHVERSKFHFHLDHINHAHNLYESPAFLLTLRSPSNVVVSLFQMDRRAVGAPEYLHIGFQFFALDPEASTEDTVEALVSCSSAIQSFSMKEETRELSSGEMRLKQGSYLILPFATSATDFDTFPSPSVANRSPLIEVTHGQNLRWRFSRPCEKLFKDLFERIDMRNVGRVFRGDIIEFQARQYVDQAVSSRAIVPLFTKSWPLTFVAGISACLAPFLGTVGVAAVAFAAPMAFQSARCTMRQYSMVNTRMILRHLEDCPGDGVTLEEFISLHLALVTKSLPPPTEDVDIDDVNRVHRALSEDFSSLGYACVNGSWQHITSRGAAIAIHSSEACSLSLYPLDDPLKKSLLAARSARYKIP